LNHNKTIQNANCGHGTEVGTIHLTEPVNIIGQFLATRFTTANK